MRRAITTICFSLFIATSATAEPAEHWQPLAAGNQPWVQEITRLVEGYAEKRQPTAIMVVRKDGVVASWGAVDHKVDVASVRKSLLSALYGIAVAEDRIRLDSTLAELGIDDKPPRLTEAEKRATIADLLTARSGIYHPAAHETKEIKAKRPKRGSHAPGAFWFYNNWDFNALGTIYRQRTGEDIFASFAKRIARPIGMEDFSKADGHYALEKASDHPAYPFRLTARDAARFGLLFANGGSWQGRQVIPEAWVKDSTRPHAWTNRGHRGYGYMWWELSSEPWGKNGAYAAGFGGQYIAFLPAKGLVIVQTVDRDRRSRELRTSRFIALVKKIVAAAPGN